MGNARLWKWAGRFSFNIALVIYSAMYHLELLTIEESQDEEFREIRETARHHLPRLSDDELAKVVSLVIGTCAGCHRKGWDCNCYASAARP